MKQIYLALSFMILASFMAPASSQAEVTWQDIRDAILEKRTFTTQELQDMDVNGDNQVDVADLVYFKPDPVTLIGEHIGILFRDNANIIEGQSGVIGQMPFALEITSEDPLQGEIDNQSDEMGHYSLYFPKGIFPVIFSKHTETEMDFQVTFTTTSSNLSPDADLKRKIAFDGEFTDSGKRVLTGTYTETISGFKDNQGDDIPITLTGKFILILTTD